MAPMSYGGRPAAREPIRFHVHDLTEKVRVHGEQRAEKKRLPRQLRQR